MASDLEALMHRAVVLSQRGFPAPNPHVGCVIVKDGSIVGEGWHEAAGQPHAEVVALNQAGALSRSADVFVTLEPCAHQGRTGPCADALIKAQVKRVYIACLDPNPKAAGGALKLREAGIEVHVGLGEAKAKVANRVFMRSHEIGRPFVSVKAAVTLDGFMARSDGSSKWITQEAARREGHRLRAEMGSVLVGRQTVVADDPQLTARVKGVQNQPTRILLDPHATLTGSEKLFQQDGDVLWIVAEGQRTTGSQVECRYSTEFDLPALMALLFSKGIRGILVEGGPRTIQSFLAAGIVDEMNFFIAPCVFGQGLRLWSDTVPPTEFTLERVHLRGPDVQMTYSRKGLLKLPGETEP